MIKEGSKAPQFTLKNQDGQKISLKDFLGKKVVLYFYPKDMTSGCTKEACDFRDHIELFNNQNVVVLGVSADSIDLHKKFKSKYNLPFDLLSDDSKKVLEKYGVWKEKSMYGKKYFGIERTTIIIDENGRIKKIFPKVKVNGHVKEVLEALKD